ncbi:MAG: GerMN domain-containing protein [Acidimicrobiales bacterium]
MTARRLPRLCVGLCALVIVLVTAGCGITVQTSAQPISVPADLFHTAASKLLHHGRPVDVYFLTGSHLVASTRFVPEGRVSLDATLQDTLNVLSAGPTTSELRSGISTAMSEVPPAELTLVGNVRDGVASVNLDSSFSLLDATQLFQSNGQIVYTLTQFPQVRSVNIVFAGLREAWLEAGQERFNGTVNRTNYLTIRPLAT